VFILNRVKVLCFDTLLQVLILKEMEIQDVREVKDVKEMRDGTPPRVFWGKRLQAIEKKGGESKKERQEISRGGKFLKNRGLEAEQRRGPARLL
jgi:hypothetical protein